MLRHLSKQSRLSRIPRCILRRTKYTQTKRRDEDSMNDRSDVRSESVDDFVRHINHKRSKESMTRIDKYMFRHQMRIGRVIKEVFQEELDTPTIDIFRKFSELKDFSIIDCLMSKDCSHASIIWSYQSKISQQDIDFINTRLNERAIVSARGLIAKHVIMKFVPQVRFFYDSELQELMDPHEQDEAEDLD